VSGLDELLRDVRSGRGSGGGLGDLLGGILGGQSGGSLAGGGWLGGNPMLRMLLPLVASMLMNGGLQKLLSRLRAQGHGEQAESWVGTGPNKPVDATDVRQAMDDEELAGIAQQLGISQDEAAEAVAEVLPEVVDQVTPTGELPDDAELDQKFGRLHELGGPGAQRAGG
jgi:uncharacterized protein YidB (DUF937 family)